MVSTVNSSYEFFQEIFIFSFFLLIYFTLSKSNCTHDLVSFSSVISKFWNNFTFRGKLQGSYREFPNPPPAFSNAHITPRHDVFVKTEKPSIGMWLRTEPWTLFGAQSFPTDVLFLIRDPVQGPDVALRCSVPWSPLVRDHFSVFPDLDTSEEHISGML